MNAKPILFSGDMIRAILDGRIGSDRWRPSIHMPRWASRITLKITDVRVQRIQEISEDDAAAEGVKQFKTVGSARDKEWYPETYQHNFELLWNQINDKRGFGWHTNPWVWALTFEVIRENVDAVLSKAA